MSIKISGMPAATTLTGTESIPLVQGGLNKIATPAQIMAGGVLSAGNFTAATLNGTWANVAGFAPAGFRLNAASGNVELKGYIQSGTTATAAFSLQVGMRPAAKRIFVVAGNGTTPTTVTVDTTGIVTPTYGTGGTTAGLDNIMFKAEA